MADTNIRKLTCRRGLFSTIHIIYFTFEFFLNVFTEFSQFNNRKSKNKRITVFDPVKICLRDKDANTKLTLIHTQNFPNWSLQVVSSVFAFIYIER